MGLNEGERLFLPDRSSVPVPGSRLSLGDVLASLKSGGCFLLFFAGIGVALFLFGVAGTFGPYRDILRESGDPRFFMAAMAFGFVFFLFPLRMLQVTITSAKHSSSRSKPRQTAGPRWESDYPWKREGMPPDYTASSSGAILGRVAFLSFIGLFNIAWQAPGIIFKIVIIVLDLFALLIIYDAVHKFVQWLRYKNPVIRYDTFPARPGERFRATVRFPRSLSATGPAEATLRCVQDRSIQEQGHARLQPFKIWSQATTIDIPSGQSLSELRIDLEVPGHLPESNLSANEAVYWQVLLKVPVTGPDFETVFLVPIYS